MEPFGKSLLVIGGARSGKSRLAQRRAESCGRPPVFVATAEARDEEMRARILRHRADRDNRWTTVEEPVDLPGLLGRRGGEDVVLLVDCLTLWASNLLLAGEDVAARTDALVAAIAAARATLIFVSNEVGLGIVPDNALARAFRDAAGLMNQRVAAAVDCVDFIAAGLPMRLKGRATP